MRNEITMKTIQKRELEKAEAEFLETNHIPNIKASLLVRSMSTKSPRSDLMKIRKANAIQASMALPPLKQAKDEQETEMKNLIKKNLIHEMPRNYSKL